MKYNVSVTMRPYSARFFREQEQGSARSAACALPELLKWISPCSVVDVGCGVGTWLREFQSNGVQDVLGIDGEYVDRSTLAIDAGNFEARDLTQSVRTSRVFDLAVSLEVGEHLPPGRAASFVEDLCRLAPLVLFSAAIPGQGGTNHVNEQWQSYWAGLFQQCAYQPCDLLRAALWNDDGVEFWYAQNMMLYASEEAIKANPRLTKSGWRGPMDIVHPRLLAASSAQRALPSQLRRLLRLAGA